MRVRLVLLFLACFTSCALAIQIPWEVLPFASRIQAAFLDRLNIAPAPSHQGKVIRLQQVYHQGTVRYPGLSARLDVGVGGVSASSSGTRNDVQGVLRTKRVKTWKPRDTQDYLHAHRHGDGVGIKASLNDMEWDEIEVDAPDVEDRETLLTLAKMASKAYEEPSNKSNGDWTIGGKQEWNLVSVLRTERTPLSSASTNPLWLSHLHLAGRMTASVDMSLPPKTTQPLSWLSREQVPHCSIMVQRRSATKIT